MDHISWSSAVLSIAHQSVPHRLTYFKRQKYFLLVHYTIVPTPLPPPPLRNYTIEKQFIHLVSRVLPCPSLFLEGVKSHAPSSSVHHSVL